jgi:hypothetical protein
MASASGAPAQTATSGSPDDTCIKVRQVFFGFNDIAKRGNTKIIPFSKQYHDQLAAYFERGCPRIESFPVPSPGTDMSLANTAADVVVSGGIKFQLGEPLLR